MAIALEVTPLRAIWRAGFRFEGGPVQIEAADLTADKVLLLVAEPALIVAGASPEGGELTVLEGLGEEHRPAIEAWLAVMRELVLPAPDEGALARLGVPADDFLEQRLGLEAGRPDDDSDLPQAAEGMPAGEPAAPPTHTPEDTLPGGTAPAAEASAPAADAPAAPNEIPASGAPAVEARASTAGASSTETRPAKRGRAN